MSDPPAVVLVTAAVVTSERDGTFERQAPQDLSAEQSVLGGMLLSKAIADVVEVMRSEDFYRPAHQLVFDVVLGMCRRGEPADPETVAAELTSLGKLPTVGGAPYPPTLISSVPTAANAGFYAVIVAERAVQRRAIEAATRIVQLDYGVAAGSGPCSVDSDVVILMHRDDTYNRESPRAVETDLILAKNLNGPTGLVTVAFQASTLQFGPMYGGEDPDRESPPGGGAPASGGLRLLPGGNSAPGGRR